VPARADEENRLHGAMLLRRERRTDELERAFDVDGKSGREVQADPVEDDAEERADRVERHVASVETVRASGINCVGPVSSDVIFLKALKGEYDGVVMMYHDQGQIATKLLGFNKGVTVTAGLKTVFTTPAHGTAFDIVGQGKADTGALEQALRIGAKLAAAKNQATAVKAP